MFSGLIAGAADSQMLRTDFPAGEAFDPPFTAVFFSKSMIPAAQLIHGDAVQGLDRAGFQAEGTARRADFIACQRVRFQDG